MKALIIGGGGFVGRYLAEHLVQDCGWETFLTKLPKENVEVEGCEAYNLDILDKDAVEALLVRLKPDAILHLAAQSSVAYSWKNPQLTADINIHGCLNVLDAVRSVPGYAPKILLIGSGEEYGVLPENTSLVSETTPVHPANPYAITKLAQNLFGELYAKAYDMHIMMVRAFNHIGPGQLPQFVVSDFCKQVAEISAGVRFLHGHGVELDLALLFVGFVTAIPMIAFSYAAPRLPMLILGFIQYLNPILVTSLGVLFFGESLTRTELIPLLFIWSGIAIYLASSIVRNRRALRLRHPKLG